jgi:protein-disulfide isomerase
MIATGPFGGGSVPTRQGLDTEMMRKSAPIASALVLGLGLAASSPRAAAQSLPQQNQEILNELKAIRQLLEKLAGPLGQPSPTPTAAAPVDDRVKLVNVTGRAIGKADAPLTMVEFTDLQCPFCRQFHVTTFEQIKKEYVDTGKLRYISRDFPLDTIHPYAIAAAQASRCAADQDKFWEMRHTILVNNAGLNADVFNTFAQDLKMNVTAFKSCEAAAPTTFQTDLQKDRTDAATVGVSGTPTFVIGRTNPNGLDGVRIVGAQPFAAFDAKLKELLSKPPSP